MEQVLETDKIESRAYQEVIAASARDKNTLVVLPTGLGKTVIAAMVASQKVPEGKVLFMAPTKPLVEQHLSTFRELLAIDDEDMTVLTGETSPEERYRIWGEKKIFFATPQVVENDLIAGKVPREEFSLVVFDEAHRATGEYSYVFISEKMRAQKLALTASPGGDKEQILQVADNLEIENFEVRTEDDPDVEPYLHRKEVEWIEVSLDERFREAKNNLEEAKREQLKKLKSMGMLDSVSRVNKKQLLKLRGKLGSKASSGDDPKYYSGLSLVATALKISQALELLETQGVSQCYEYMEGLKNDDSKAASRALNNEKLQKARSMVEYLKKKGEEHPKLDRLREILGDIDEGEKAIVFTEYRASADRIAEELNTEGLKAVKFVGQRGDSGMTQKKQIDVLEAFEKEKYNVLVSTSIGEEGLDIPSVDYVVFYEPVPSAVRDIQRSGRTARQQAGKIYVLMAENTRDEAYYWSSQNQKKEMNEVLEELKDEKREKGGQKTLDGFSGEVETVIYADDRENSVAKELSRMEITVRKKRLEVADFLVSDATAVERKRADDFVDSVLDQRLFSQLEELQQFSNPVLIIEGDDLYSHREVHPNAIRGALATIALDYGIPILWSDDVRNTAELLKSLARREQEDKDREIAIRGEKAPKTESELKKFVVAGLPGVNTKIAERLLEEFGTVKAVFTASESELKDVEGLGDKKASRIKELIET